MKKFIAILCIFIQMNSFTAEKQPSTTYVLDGLVFKDSDDLPKNLDTLKKLISKRKEQVKTKCCNEEFTFAQFYKHISHNHKDNDKYRCSNPQCGYASDAVTSVQHHYFYDHVSSKVFVCPKCTVGFREQSILKRHFEKCIRGTLARGSRGSNDNMKRSLNEKIANLNQEQTSHFKTKFNNYHELSAYVHSTKQGNYFSCVFKGCTNTDSDVKKMIDCSIKHIDPDFFTCHKCSEHQNSYEELNAHIKKCFNYKKQIPAINKPEQTNESEQQLIIRFDQPFQAYEPVAYSQQPALPTYGVEEHPTDSIMQRLTQNNNNSNPVSDRDQVRQALLKRLQSKK